MKRQQLPLYLLLIGLLMGFCFSCMDEQLIGTSYPDGINGPDEGERDMRLRVAVSGTRNTSGNSGPVGKEDRIDTLDVLVSAPGGGKHVWRYAATGTPVEDTDGNTLSNTFEVVMPLGEDFDVHVFVNSHEALVRAGAFNRPGSEMQGVLASINQNLRGKLEDPKASLPMHGVKTGVDINKDSDDKLTVSVLRSVAKVSVMINGTVSDQEGDQILNGGTLKEFKMREMYAFYPADSGRVATADTTKYITIKPDSGNVKSATLPPEFKAGNRPDSISIINKDDISALKSIYLYENIPWSKDGFDYATTRMVVGGIFTDKEGKQDTDKDGQPRVSYYRVNFQHSETENGKPVDVQYPVLRNHNYVFNIVSVAAPGYDTPRQAAEGKPINISVTMIDWMDDLQNIDYDGQHYFKTSTKEIRLPRNLNSEIVLPVECDVPADEWKWYFKEKTNGATTPQTWYKKKTDPGKGNDSIAPTKSLIFENSRFKVERVPILDSANKPTERVTLKFTARKLYSDKPSQLPEEDESYRNILVIEVKNLRIRFNIEQLDKSPDDWGNGGDNGSDVGGKGEEGDVGGVELPDWNPGNGVGTPPDEELEFD